MHNKQLTKVDTMKIITVTLHILLKRDMSLNRRIYAWFLGTEQLPTDNTSQQQQINEIHSSSTSLAVTNDPFDSSSYFTQYTQENLIQSLLHALETVCSNTILTNPMKSKPTTPDENHSLATSIAESLPSTWTLTKLIRVLIILVDKPDVGPNILESVLMSYLLIVYQQVYLPAKQLTAINAQQENTRTETLKTLNMLLETFEPYFIWEFLTKNFDSIINEQQEPYSITAGTTIEQLCGIINMLLDIASLDSSTDIQSEHLPEMLYRLIKTMNNNIQKFTADQITLCIEILLKILKKVVPTNTTHRLSILHCSMSGDLLSISEQKPITEFTFDDPNFSESDLEEDDEELPREQIDTEYSVDVENKSTDIEQNQDIERLLRQMVRKVEKQIYKLNNEPKKTPVITETMLQSMSHLEKSLTLYKNFFHRFVSTFLLDSNQISLNDKFQTIYSITQKKTNENLRALFNHYQHQNEFQLKLNENVEHYKRAFDDCCKLLIEFCCFPRQSTLLKSKPDFDDWSIDLCILAVCQSGHFSIQTIAISVLIELLGFTLCLSNPKSSDGNSTGTDLILPENVSIIPSFNQEQVNLLINETLFFQHITAYLWEHLSDRYERQSNLKASRLLAMLHSMLPNGDCEDLICNQLSLTQIQQYENEMIIIDAYKRFFKLWNLTREVSIVTFRHLMKTFEHCLLIVINILRESTNYCLKSMVQQWISDCFIHSDIYRIFDILLTILLNPDTARISVQKLHPVNHREYFLNRQTNLIDQISLNSNYQTQESNISNDTDDMSVGDINEITFSILIDAANNNDDDGGDDDDEEDDDENYDDDETNTGEQEESDEEKRICAISGTDTGEIIYHIKQSSPQPNKSNAMKPPTTLSLSQPTLINNSRSVSPTASSKNIKRRAPTMPTVFSRNNSSIESNSTKSSQTNIQRMYASLHEETSTEIDSLDEKQLMNTTTNNTNSKTPRPHSVGPIPHAVTLDGLSDSTISPLQSLNDSDSLPNHNNSTKKLESIERSRKIDSHLAYLLLYTQPYDYHRVIFSLNIIESLIDLIPQQLIHTFIVTNHIQSSPIHLHNHRLHELAFRHRRSIEGKNFYATLESFLPTHHQSYLYTFINILLIYTRTYYSKSFEHRLTVQDLQGNRKVQIHALILLKRICHDLSYICMEHVQTDLQLINYLNELFQKLSFQKTILHLFNTIIEKIYYKQRLNKSKSLTKMIYDYNIGPLYDELTRQYLRELVQLLEQMILLENIFHFYQQRHDNQTPIQTFASNILASVTSNNLPLVKGNQHGSISSFQFRNHTDIDYIHLMTKTNQLNSTSNPLKYIDHQPIVNQSLFLSSILQYLKQLDFIENHRHIISLVVRILPHCGSSLKSISSLVIEQISRNLCFVVQTHNEQLQQQNKNKFK